MDPYVVKLEYEAAENLYNKGYMILRGRGKNAARLNRMDMGHSWQSLKDYGYFKHAKLFYINVKDLAQNSYPASSHLYKG